MMTHKEAWESGQFDREMRRKKIGNPPQQGVVGEREDMGSISIDADKRLFLPMDIVWAGLPLTGIIVTTVLLTKDWMKSHWLYGMPSGWLTETPWYGWGSDGNADAAAAMANRVGDRLGLRPDWWGDEMGPIFICDLSEDSDGWQFSGMTSWGFVAIVDSADPAWVAYICGIQTDDDIPISQVLEWMDAHSSWLSPPTGSDLAIKQQLSQENEVSGAPKKTRAELAPGGEAIVVTRL